MPQVLPKGSHAALVTLVNSGALRVLNGVYTTGFFVGMLLCLFAALNSDLLRPNF